MSSIWSAVWTIGLSCLKVHFDKIDYGLNSCLKIDFMQVYYPHIIMYITISELNIDFDSSIQYIVIL